LLNLVCDGSPFKALAYEERLALEPHQNRQTLGRYQTGAADLAEALFGPLDQGGETAALENEMAVEPRYGHKPDLRRGKTLELPDGKRFAHILYRPRSSSFSPSSHLRSSSLFTLSETVPAIFEDCSTESST